MSKEEPKQDFYKIGDFHKNCDDGCKYHCTKGNTQLAECLVESKQEFCDNCNNNICCCIVKKQETIEEIFDKIDDVKCRYSTEESQFWSHYRIGVLDGLEYNQESIGWQKERMYSEEDIKNFGWLCRERSLTNVDLLFEKFKKK